MKKLLLGLAAGIAAGYVIRKMEEERRFEAISDYAREVALKAKKRAKDLADVAQNEAEYVRDRVEYAIEKNKAKLTAAAGKGKPAGKK